MGEPSAALQPPPLEPGLVDRVFGMFNIFFDPEAAAKSIRRPGSWIAPLVLSSLVIGVCSYLMVPTAISVMQISPPGNMTPDQVNRSLPMFEKMYRVSSFATPLFIGGMTAFFAAILAGISSLMNIKAHFKETFSLLAHTGLITAVAFFSTFMVVKAKGDDIQSMQELKPGFGLDLLLADGANKYLHTVLNYFSMFTIWNIVMVALTFAVLTEIRKGQAFAATAPLWILGLLMTLFGAFFQR
jgi:Yip1 domain